MEPQRRRGGGAVLLLRRSPKHPRVGRGQAAPGASPAPLPPWIGIKNPPAPRSSQAPARSCPAEGERRVSGVGWWDFAPPPPGTHRDRSLYSARSNAVPTSHRGTPRAFLHSTPLCPCFGAIQALLRPRILGAAPAWGGDPHQIHGAWRGLYCTPHVEATGGSFLHSPVELGVPAAPEGLFPHGRGESLVHLHPVRSPWPSSIWGAGVPRLLHPPISMHRKKRPGRGLYCPPTRRGGSQRSLSLSLSLSPGKGSRCPRGPLGTGILAVVPAELAR